MSNSHLHNTAMLLARVCLTAIFILAGYDKIMHFDSTAQMMASQGIPYSDIFLVIAIIFEFGGGLLVLLGLQARLGAFLLFLFVIPVTFVFHPFWNIEDMASMQNQMQHFYKNLTILGGMLYVMVCGAGCYSLDALLKRKK